MILWILEDNAERIAAFQAALRPFDVEARHFRSSREFIAALDARDALPEVISLDHDLSTFSGIDLGSGTEASEALKAVPPFASIVVSTTNVTAASRMVEGLRAMGWEVDQIVPHDGLEWIVEWRELIRNRISQSISIRHATVLPALWLRLDDRARMLLASKNIGLLGLIDRGNQLILVEMSPRLDAARLSAPGHQDVLMSGWFRGTWAYGFSVVIRGGEPVALNRRSTLNHPAADFCLPADRLPAIFELLGLPGHVNCRVFPNQR